MQRRRANGNRHERIETCNRATSSTRRLSSKAFKNEQQKQHHLFRKTQPRNGIKQTTFFESAEHTQGVTLYTIWVLPVILIVYWTPCAWLSQSCPQSTGDSPRALDQQRSFHCCSWHLGIAISIPASDPEVTHWKVSNQCKDMICSQIYDYKNVILREEFLTKQTNSSMRATWFNPFVPRMRRLHEILFPRI